MSTSASIQHVQQRHSIIRESSRSMCVLQISPELQREGWERGNHPEGPVKLGDTPSNLATEWRLSVWELKTQQLKPKSRLQSQLISLHEPLHQAGEGWLPLLKKESLSKETPIFQFLRACLTEERARGAW